jgi:hypothetical protein
VRADVAERGRAEECVNDRMRRDIGIGMAKKSFVGWKLNATEHKPTSCCEPMDVVTNADWH